MKILVWITFGLVGGMVLIWTFGVIGESPLPANNNPATVNANAADLELRVTMLETQLAEEVQMRRQLEDALDNMLLEQWSAAPLESEAVSQNERDDESSSDLTPEQRREQLLARRQERETNRLERRTERLQEVGFSPDQTQWILDKEEEMRLERLNQQWEQRRERFLQSEGANRADNGLREELGEAEYERYLEATGRSTSVYVSQLMNNSPAQVAGFQPGDEIVRYNGERVYDYNDLNRANVQGQLGEPVVIDIVRDGVPMQLVVERGPLGIVGSRRRGYRGR